MKAHIFAERDNQNTPSRMFLRHRASQIISLLEDGTYLIVKDRSGNRDARNMTLLLEEEPNG